MALENKKSQSSLLFCKVLVSIANLRFLEKLKKHEERMKERKSKKRSFAQVFNMCCVYDSMSFFIKRRQTKTYFCMHRQYKILRRCQVAVYSKKGAYLTIILQ